MGEPHPAAICCCCRLLIDPITHQPPPPPGCYTAPGAAATPDSLERCGAMLAAPEGWPGPNCTGRPLPLAAACPPWSRAWASLVLGPGSAAAGAEARCCSSVGSQPGVGRLQASGRSVSTLCRNSSVAVATCWKACRNGPFPRSSLYCASTSGTTSMRLVGEGTPSCTKRTTWSTGARASRPELMNRTGAVRCCSWLRGSRGAEVDGCASDWCCFRGYDMRM